MEGKEGNHIGRASEKYQSILHGRKSNTIFFCFFTAISIVFQADQAVVCVVQVRQPDVTIVNMTMSVMHQVLEKHQFMPDVIAVVGEGVLTKNRHGEKQRGKMLSLFMSAKMYVRLGSLLVVVFFLILELWRA